MKLKTTNPEAIKSVGSSGEFEGYGAVYNNKDLQGDVIVRGAFKEIKKNANGKLTIALHHDLRDVVGEATMTEDDNGLYIVGKLNLNIASAKEAYERMKSGLMNAMSVGFNILDGGQRMIKGDDGEYYNEISKAELWETSIVTFGANPEALISSVKHAKPLTIREFEHFLQKNGFSKREAVGMASHGFNFEKKLIEASEAKEIKRLFEEFNLN